MMPKLNVGDEILETDREIMRDLRKLGLLERNRAVLIMPLDDLPDSVQNSIRELNRPKLDDISRQRAKRPYGSGGLRIPDRISGPGVYLLRSDGLTKIGCTSNLRNRMATYWRAIPGAVELFAFLPTRSFRATEWLLHQKFRNKRTKGEWFDLSEDDLTAIVSKSGLLLVNKSLDDFLSEPDS